MTCNKPVRSQLLHLVEGPKCVTGSVGNSLIKKIWEKEEVEVSKSGSGGESVMGTSIA